MKPTATKLLLLILATIWGLCYTVHLDLSWWSTALFFSILMTAVYLGLLIAFLKDRDLSWLINFLLDNGPQTDLHLSNEASCNQFDLFDKIAAKLDLIYDLNALYVIKKLWRINLANGYYTYGIQGVHPRKPLSSQLHSTPNAR